MSETLAAEKVVPDPFFDGVAPVPVPLTGGTCDLPILYRDASQFGVFFRFDLDRAARLLEGTSVEPWPVLGKAIGAIYAWEYRDSTVGAYGELGLGIQARKRGSRPSLVRLGLDMTAQDDQGIWVVNLPVTTEAARRAGVEIWGYPKYVAPIETHFTAEGASVRLADELELSIGRLGGPRRILPVVTFTGKDERLVRTTVRTGEKVQFGRASSAVLRVVGDGPTAATVRALGLDTAAKVLAFRADRFKAILPAGIDAGPLRA